MTAEPEEQSPQTRAWVKRRDAVDAAIAAVAARSIVEKAAEERVIAQEQAGSPLPLILGFLVALAVLLSLGWFLMVRLECDPMWSDRGLSSACRRAP